jgi:hypothetical protein
MEKDVKGKLNETVLKKEIDDIKINFNQLIESYWSSLK